MLKFITVIVICYFGKLEKTKVQFSDPRQFTRDPQQFTRNTRRLDYLFIGRGFAYSAKS